MSTPKFAVINKSAAPKANQAVVYAVVTDGASVIISGLEKSHELATLNLGAIGAKATKEHTVRVASAAGGSYLLIGSGAKELTSATLRELAGAATRALAGVKNIVLALPTTSAEQALAALEGAAIGNYRFESFKGKPTASVLENVTVVTNHKPKPAALADLNVTVEAMAAVRDMANTPPNVLYPATMAADIVKAAKGTGVKVTVLTEKELKANRLVGILAVGQGSTRGPRMVKLEYKPAGAKRHLALVGKGITFDSGGLTLKPGIGMLGMKYDMTGAATVGHAILAIARLGLKVRVTAYMCVAENLPSGSASRPNDVIRYRNGKTVEITNTDAEGRLVLADGLILASESKPDLIVDVATLTGAATVALGTRHTGLMGNDEGTEALLEAAKKVDEKVWRMPLSEELRDNLKSEVADMVNSKLGDPAGGMMVGGLFLSEFVGNKSKTSEDQLAWAHLDIASTANNGGAPYGYLGKGPTGVIFRTLIQTARDLV